MSSPERIVVGIMTGTSLDGLDLAMVRIRGSGLAMTVELIRASRNEVDFDDLAQPLRDVAAQKPMAAAELAGLAWRFGEIHADAIQSLRETLAIDGNDHPPDLVAVHGQTVFHRPPISWQLLNPAPIARAIGCDVVHDLRQADLAAGGQGAPITPLADWIMFSDPAARVAVVNLGGFCNITILPADDGVSTLDDIRGFDLCVCNQILDAAARRMLRLPYDIDGEAAMRGVPDGALRSDLLDRLVAQRDERRSLGTDDGLNTWVQDAANRLPANDLLATIASAIGVCIGREITSAAVDRVVLAGGGAMNARLVQTILDARPTDVVLHTEATVAREPIAMAVLGALCADGVPITLPAVTGCVSPAPVSGVWTRFR